MAIIQAILFMDETLVGLDTASLGKVQNALKKYLPEITVLCIDHHASDNNQNGFYDSKIHCSNHTLSLTQEV